MDHSDPVDRIICDNGIIEFVKATKRYGRSFMNCHLFKIDSVWIYYTRKYRERATNETEADPFKIIGSTRNKFSM